MNASAIKLSQVNKWFGDLHVLQDIDLTVNEGERVVVCGPSGSGKSTMIRCINRLESHQSGEIHVHGTLLDDNTKNIQQVRREVGMVFQQFNLFPHLTVLRNLTLAPMRARKMSPQDAEALAHEYLERVLSPKGEWYIKEHYLEAEPGKKSGTMMDISLDFLPARWKKIFFASISCLLYRLASE